MSKYTGIQKEETLKAQVYKDFFEKFKYNYEPNIGNIDFVISEPKTSQKSLLPARHFLWAEAKKGREDIFSMLTQLVLTCRKTYERGDYDPPPYIGCFDATQMVFVPFRAILPIFRETDFNWNITPSNYIDPDFSKAREKVEKLVFKDLIQFDIEAESKEILEFIKKSLTSHAPSAKVYITADNFVHIYNRWVKEVKPTINISQKEWQENRENGVFDCDFYMADIMSKDGEGILDSLKVVLQHDAYKFHVKLNGYLFYRDIDFTDGGKAYMRFWNRYERPPLEEYQKEIVTRHDLLMPQNIRQIKGSFFTPPQWVEKSQEYLAKVFGKNWQKNYYIWDCAAGTGNLLAGLTNAYNIWASTIDETDVDSMIALLNDFELDGKKNAGKVFNLLEDHIFQFDFLNDSFDKLPQGLRDIIKDPEKRKKLIIYINPPYAESASSHGRSGKKAVEQSKMHDQYADYLGHAQKELSIQFFTRIYFEIPDCKIAEFSTFKGVSAPRFKNYRSFFKAKIKKSFAVPSWTFDNVPGKFPIGFKIWDLGIKEKITNCHTDVFDQEGNFLQEKNFWAYDGDNLINDWCDTFKEPFTVKDSIATLVGVANDFQQQNIVFFDKPYKKVIASNHNIQVTKKNLIEACIYYSVRKCIPANWLNNKDNFLWPNDGWKQDKNFQNDCLVNCLFNNAIKSAECVNHWIPFTEQEVGARDNFTSHFMSGLIKKYKLSPEAKAVMSAGKELWRYYHKTIKTNRQASVDASLYDIRAFFQGRDDKGRMNAASGDETYNSLIKALRDALKTLAEQIQPKVYEYGFLKE